jgi:hypothetical protein
MGRKKQMKYTEIKYNKRIANSNIQWLSDALQSKVDILSYIEKILVEMKFEKDDAITYRIADMVLGLDMNQDSIMFNINKWDSCPKHNLGNLGYCMITIENYKSKNPKLLEIREDFLKGTEYTSECYLGQDHQYRFIDTLIQSVRFLWEIK